MAAKSLNGTNYESKLEQSQYHCDILWQKYFTLEAISYMQSTIEQNEIRKTKLKQDRNQERETESESVKKRKRK